MDTANSYCTASGVVENNNNNLLVFLQAVLIIRNAKDFLLISERTKNKRPRMEAATVIAREMSSLIRIPVISVLVAVLLMDPNLL